MNGALKHAQHSLPSPDALPPSPDALPLRTQCAASPHAMRCLHSPAVLQMAVGAVNNRLHIVDPLALTFVLCVLVVVGYLHYVLTVSLCPGRSAAHAGGLIIGC